MNEAKKEADRRLPMSLLLAVFVLSTASLLGSLSAPDRDPQLVTLHDSIEMLERTYLNLRREFREPMTRLRESIDTIYQQLDPYQEPSESQLLKERFTGLAAKSSTVRGLAQHGNPNIAWTIRNLQFCWGSLAGKSFRALAVIEIEWTGHLLRLNHAEAASIDSNLTRVWMKSDLPSSDRGNPRAFTAFTETLWDRPGLLPVCQLTNDDYSSLIDLIYTHNQKHNVGGFAGNGEGVLIGQTRNNLDSLLSMTPSISVPGVDLSIPWRYWPVTYPLLLLFLNYVAFTAWRERQDRESCPRILSISWLLSLEGDHHALNIGGLVLLCALAVAALSLLGQETIRDGRYAIFGLLVLTLICSGGTWVWRIPYYDVSRDQVSIRPTESKAREESDEEPPAPPPQRRLETECRPQDSTVFFYERMCDAFPGIRDLAFLDDPGEVKDRLKVLLRNPLTVDHCSPIWEMGHGSVAIKRFAIVDGERVLLGPHRYRIGRLAVYRPMTYWRSFIVLFWDPDTPTGLYPDLLEDGNHRPGEIGLYTEEYGVWQDELQTREEYDDGSMVRDGKIIRTRGARLEVRQLERGAHIIAAQLSPLHELKFDPERYRWLCDLVAGSESMENFIARIEELPKHTRDF